MSASELSNDSDTTLLLHFNGNTIGASGETPSIQTGLTFPEGLIEKGVLHDDSSTLRYDTAGNLSPNEGTIEFWFNPTWNGNTNRDFIFFEVGNGSNGFLIAMDGANNLRFLQYGDDPSTPAIETNVETNIGISGSHLAAGTWNHVAASWRRDTREMGFYLNGKPIEIISETIRISNFSTSDFTIGSGINGRHSSKAIIDEFRISNRARNALEILYSFNVGLDGSI